MPYLVALAFAVAVLPLSVGAQTRKEAPTSAAVAVHGKSALPPQLMLRASYYLYLDADADTDATSDPTNAKAEEPAPSSEPARDKGSSRLERWHPEAFKDPSKPEPSVELELDSSGLEVTPSAPMTVEDSERQEAKQGKGRQAGVAVGVILGITLVAVAVGAGVAISKWDL